MIDAHRHPDHLTARAVLGQRIDDLPLGALPPHPHRIDRHHAPAAIEGVDGSDVGAGAQAPDGEALARRARWTIFGQPQAEGLGGIDEELLRRLGNHHVRAFYVKAMSRWPGRSSSNAAAIRAGSLKV